MKHAETLVAIAASLLLASGPAHAGWEFVASMPTSRVYHAASVAGDRWYVAEGNTTDQAFPTEVDVYDPTTGQWTALAGGLAVGRSFGVAMTNPGTGHVLFPGGESPSLTGYDACDLAASGVVLGVPALGHARFYHAGAFAAGKFIVTGGFDQRGANRLDDAETWDETQASWHSAGVMPGGSRVDHSMTVFANGKDVLVIGGCQMDHGMAAVDLYDGNTGEWSVAAPLNLPRCAHRSVQLADGRVLVSGGIPLAPSGVYNSVEIYDPAADKWTLAAPMFDHRYDHGLALLPDGRVIAVAGSNDDFHGEVGALSSAEVYDPAADTWSPLAPLHDRRRWPVVAVLSDGVYVAGGAWGEYPATGNPIIQVHVLDSVERLSWADLGIAPANSDAGSSDGASSGDGGVPDGASVADSATDSESPGSTENGDGCSCQSSGAGRASAVSAFSASALLALAWLSRRTRRHRHTDIAPRG